MVKQSKVKSCLNLKSIYMGDTMLYYPLVYLLRGEVKIEFMSPMTRFTTGMMKQSISSGVFPFAGRSEQTVQANVNRAGTIQEAHYSQLQGT